MTKKVGLMIYIYIYNITGISQGSMTLSHICDSVEDDFWLRSTDHRTVHFVNRSSEWLELKGSMQMGTHRNMSAISRIPPKAVYTHRFVGRSYFQIYRIQDCAAKSAKIF